MIPVCNLSGDMHLNMIDVLYARQLHMTQHLVWYSDTAKPDLGGHEDKNYQIYLQDQLENPNLSNKGFYRTYCCELSIHTFAPGIIL